MGKTNRLQTDFLAGEISPRMEMQDNLEGRKHGVERMENFFTHLQGTAETSRGTEWVDDIPESDGRMFGFPVTYVSSFMVIITNGRTYVYSSAGEEAAFSSPWADLEPIQAAMVPNENTMVITSRNYPPYVLGLAGGVWVLAALAITDAPAAWGASNYPPAVGFFGGRMWVGGVTSDPSLFWGSKSSVYGTFTLGELDDDAIEARLGRQGEIRWIAGGAGLLMGTSNAEHIISSEGGVITPSDINSKIQSTNGSYISQSLEVGNEVMYITPDGRKLRSIGYEWLKDAWRSRDLTHASEHITKDNEITKLIYMANPDSLIMGVTAAGTIVTATYEPYSQTVGFARRSTQGTIMSIGALAYGGADELWMLVDRGRGVLEIEKEVHPDNIKLDSHTILTGSGISGGVIPRLAGVTCQVLVDGAVHPDVTPAVPSGTFTTEYSGNEIQIGRQIYSVIRTLPVADAIANIGTTRTMKKRWTELWVRILDSWRPRVEGRRTPNRRVPTPMGEVEPAITESFEVSTTGWDQDAQITIVQDLPLRTEIAGWFGRILQEET